MGDASRFTFKRPTSSKFSTRSTFTAVHRRPSWCLLIIFMVAAPLATRRYRRQPAPPARLPEQPRPEQAGVRDHQGRMRPSPVRARPLVDARASFPGPRSISATNNHKDETIFGPRADKTSQLWRAHGGDETPCVMVGYLKLALVGLRNARRPNNECVRAASAGNDAGFPRWTLAGVTIVIGTRGRSVPAGCVVVCPADR